MKICRQTLTISVKYALVLAVYKLKISMTDALLDRLTDRPIDRPTDLPNNNLLRGYTHRVTEPSHR